MSLDKAIQHGKEKRKAYRGSKAVDTSCRHGGGCKYCENNRQYKNKKRLESAKDKENDQRTSNG